MVVGAHDQGEMIYVLVQLGETTYGLRGDVVREITRWRAPTYVPGAPAVLPGIINQRGVILTVIDMRVLLGLPEKLPDHATRYVITHYEDMNTALLFDEVIDLIMLTPARFEPVPSSIETHRARLFEGLARYADRPLALLDLGAIIAAVRSD